jgi:hypothetical protein
MQAQAETYCSLPARKGGQLAALAYLSTVSSRRPPRYGNAVLSPCYARTGAIGGVADDQDTHSANDRIYEATSISKTRYGLWSLEVGRGIMYAAPHAGIKRPSSQSGNAGLRQRFMKLKKIVTGAAQL